MGEDLVTGMSPGRLDCREYNGKIVKRITRILLKQGARSDNRLSERI